MQNYTRKNGFTIVELLVAMTLGLFLLGSMSLLFFTNKTMITTQNSVAKIQDDAKFALFLIENDVALAGFRGCASGNSDVTSGFTFNNVSGTANYFNNLNYIQGFQGTGTTFSPLLDSALTSVQPSSQSDVLSIRGTTNEPSHLSADTANNATSFATNSVDGFINGGFAMVGNCFNTTLFKIQSVNATNKTVSSTTAIASSYNNQSYISPYNTITYYIGKDNILYKMINNQTPLPIIYNVDKFSILYGVDTNADGNANRYVYAPQVGDFKKVVSIRVGIVIKSKDYNTVGTKKSAYTYYFNGIAYKPNDGKLRKVYYTTIALRNLIL
jgi:type IV pilus assembly protein PilW